MDCLNRTSEMARHLCGTDRNLGEYRDRGRAKYVGGDVG